MLALQAQLQVGVCFLCMLVLLDSEAPGHQHLCKPREGSAFSHVSQSLPRLAEHVVDEGEKIQPALTVHTFTDLARQLLAFKLRALVTETRERQQT